MTHRARHINDQYFQDGRVRPGVDYALIPGEVMRSDAFRACPDYAGRVLFAIANQFRKNNNGDLSLTFGDAKRPELNTTAKAPRARDYGITSEWKLRAGLALLVDTGLLEITRQGKIVAGKGVCSLYALGWRTINASDKYDTPTVVTLPAPNRWAKWKRPDDWDAHVDRIRLKAQGNWDTNKQGSRREWKKKSHPTREDCTATDVRIENPQYRYRRQEQETDFSATDACSPSKNLGPPPRSNLEVSSIRRRDRTLKKNGAAKIGKLARLHQHLTDAELAAASHESIELVRAVRSALSLEQRP